MDTAAWFRYQVGGQLDGFDLSVERFRMLETLRSEGPMTLAEVEGRRFCARQSVFELAQRLAERGWVRIEPVTMPAADVDEASLAKSKRGQERLGRRASLLRLTEEGEGFTASVIRRHAKLVYALMRAVDLRDLDGLSRTCRKIREGDPLKLIRELMMEDLD